METPTVNQMAGAYIQNVQQELERAKAALAEQEQIVAQLEAHINECTAMLQQQTEAAPSFSPAPVAPQRQVVKNPDGSTTEKINLPNPFDQIKAQTEQKS